MRYDYECQSCLKLQEEWHSYQDKPVVVCYKCGGRCIKLISVGAMFCGVNGRANMYNFVDHNTTGKPVVINGRTQWKEHLKKHGLHDDIQNSPYTKSQLESKLQQKNRDKESNRKEIRKSVIDTYSKIKNMRNNPVIRKRVKESISKDKSNKLLKVIK